MIFLDSIWLIPMFPQFGALCMLLFGRRIDPQTAAPGGHGHDDHGHDDHGHSHHESSC
jgi:hypothetical protein